MHKSGIRGMTEVFDLQEIWRTFCIFLYYHLIIIFILTPLWLLSSLFCRSYSQSMHPKKRLCMTCATLTKIKLLDPLNLLRKFQNTLTINPHLFKRAPPIPSDFQVAWARSVLFNQQTLPKKKHSKAFKIAKLSLDVIQAHYRPA